MSLWNSLEFLHKINSILIISWVIISALFGILSWKIQSRISELNIASKKEFTTKIETTESNAKEFKNKLLESERLRIETENKLKQEIEKTNKKFEARILTNEQKDKFVDFISKTKGKVIITSVLGDAESVSFSNVIKELIVKAGWEIENTQLSQFNKNPKGIFIAVHSKETAPSYAGLLQKAFESIDIEVIVEINSKLLKNQLEIIVASKKTD